MSRLKRLPSGTRPPRTFMLALASGGLLLLVAAGTWLYLSGLPAALVRRVAPLWRTDSASEGLEALLAEADECLALGYDDRAREALSRAATVARSERESLRVLKRAYLSARRIRDYRDLERLSATALSSIPGSAALREVAAYASLRAGHPDKALRLLSGRKRKETYLWAETALRSDILVSADSLPQGLEETALLSLLAEPAPGKPPGAGPPAADPGRLAEAGRRLGDDRLILDAVLLAMKEGNLGLASEIGREDLARDSEPGFWVAYDAGDYEAALARLEALLERENGERRDLQVCHADLLLLTGRTAAAAEAYADLVRDFPEFSWKPPLNLAGLLEREGDAEGALHYRRLAAGYFPGERGVLVELARDLRRRGELEELSRLSETASRSFPDDPEVALLAFDLEGGALSGEHFRRRLWRLFERFPADGAIARRAVGFLLETGDLQGARSALTRHAAAAGEGRESWQLYARGLLEALSGSFQESVEWFDECLQQGEHWWVLHARGLALSASGRIGPALEDLRRAEAMLESSERSRGPDGDEARLRSRIRCLLGQLLWAEGEVESARRELRYARELDPGNLRVALLLKKLEEELE